MKEFEFIQSYFTEPVITGVNSSGLGNPFLQFFRNIEGPNGQETVTIWVHFKVEGLASDFKFAIVSKSIFKVNDAPNIVVSDVYDMYAKAISDLRAFLDQKIGKEGVSTIGVPMPKMEDVMEELLEVVTRLHSGV